MTSVGVAGFQSLYHKLGLGLAFMAVNHPFLDEGCILQRQRQALNFSVPTRGRTVYCKRYSFCLEGSDFASVARESSVSRCAFTFCSRKHHIILSKEEVLRFYALVLVFIDSYLRDP